MLAQMRKLHQLSNSLGRQQFWWGARNHLWPQLRVLAKLHRRTLARRVRVVAIVGSFGKTTTTAAICKVLGLAVPPPDRSAAMAALALRLLRVRPWQRHAAFEVAINGPGQMSPYGPMLRPDLVVVTSIGSEHNRSFGTLEATRAEKARMVAALGAGRHRRAQPR